jgi:hypothetical protein
VPALLAAVALAGYLLSLTVTRAAWAVEAWPGRVHLAIGWTLAVLGLVHIAATPFFHKALTWPALWFLTGGVAMSLSGALNVLQRLYGPLAPGLVGVSISANLVMTAVAVAFVWLGRARLMQRPQFLLLLTLVLAGTVLSMITGSPTLQSRPIGPAITPTRDR